MINLFKVNIENIMVTSFVFIMYSMFITWNTQSAIFATLTPLQIKWIKYSKMDQVNFLEDSI